MSYKLLVSEANVLGKGKYANGKGNTECAYFVQQATGAPSTTQWKKGKKVSEAGPLDIPRGTAIATFDDNGKYPTDGLGKHGAIYLSHDTVGIKVLDQWNAQGEVKQRTIRFGREGGSRSNNGDTFYVID